MLLALATGASAQDLTIRMPDAMLEQGFDKQLLPRFGFKHRIRIEPRTEGDADMVLDRTDAGVRVFQDAEGAIYRLVILTELPEARDKASVFLDWLRSDPGKAAIETFAPEGASVYTTEETVVTVEKTETFEGDKATGALLALMHCGRCHVVDERNRMGGIGSTPSFAAMRGRDNWPDLFRAFYAENPHPSFTQVEGVTEPFDPNREIHIAPVEITPGEIEAITAFVATIEPKDLGRPVGSN